MRIAFLPLCLAAALAATHPLDPLSKEEIAAAVEALKSGGKASASSRFPILVLREPPKQEVLNFRPGGAFRREAFVTVLDQQSHQTFEAVVDLRAKSVVSWKQVPGVQPEITPEELSSTPAIVRADPRWQDAMRKRGITDFENVQVDPWSAGHYGIAEEEGIRLVKGMSYYRGTSKNPYARPIEGVVALVNLDARKVFKVIDTGVVPVAKAASDLDMKSVGPQRRAPKPLQITQPQGVSFELEGREVRWQNWRFRFSFHPREGLVLHTVGYEDRGRLRPILYRASLSEMMVPYGDPGEAWFFRNVFDEGGYGIGRNTFPLEPLTDCPPNAVFFDALWAGETGQPVEIPRAIGLYERDGGVLWKHADYLTGHNESRRARELVLSSIATLGNYEYAFNWVFHQDGTLEMEILLTGIMQPKGVKDATHDPYAHLVAPNVAAVHHQHFFNFRLDLDVDGHAGNTVVEMDSVPVADDPLRRAFTMKETVLHEESQGQRMLNLAASRKWKVINASVKNPLGQPTGYMLLPGESALPFAQPDSSVRKRAGFLNAHLFVTPYDPEQTNAAGRYPNQSKGGDGLTRWLKANRPIENRDVVVWYSMGITHIPRPEEWPVMPVHKAGFKLVPAGFFARNPALDVPKPE
ncbi:MAG: primary-amine oxidase [Acidobacteria bacterium]|nr:primary-amine oxidase [Acidobacteriota bacterium]